MLVFMLMHVFNNIRVILIFIEPSRTAKANIINRAREEVNNIGVAVFGTGPLQ